MRVELLVSPGCPAMQETEERVKEILSQQAPEAYFQMIVVDSPEKAQVLKFPGSPTVRVNGKDIEPEADKSLYYGLG